MKGFINLLVKSGPRDLNRQSEPKIGWKSQKRITSPCAVAASIKKARIVSALTLLNKVSIVYLWSLHLVYSLKFGLSLTFVTITELITVPFGETNHTSCALYFFYSTSWKKLLLYRFFYYKVSVWKLPNNVREKVNIFCREVDVVKIKIWRMLQWNSCGQKLDVLFSIQGLRKLVKADSFAIFLFLDAKHLYTALPWFSFSLFYILLFSVHIDNANAAKSGTVLVNLSVNVYINNYIYTYDRVSVKFWVTKKLCLIDLSNFLDIPRIIPQG